MSVGRSRNGTNQEGGLLPLRSQWGSALVSGLSQLIDQPSPIGSQSTGFGGTVGGIFVVGASTKTVSTEPGYFGDLPQSQQGVIVASPPWMRP